MASNTRMTDQATPCKHDCETAGTESPRQIAARSQVIGRLSQLDDPPSVMDANLTSSTESIHGSATDEVIEDRLISPQKYIRADRPFIPIESRILRRPARDFLEASSFLPPMNSPPHQTRPARSSRDADIDNINYVPPTPSTASMTRTRQPLDSDSETSEPTPEKLQEYRAEEKKVADTVGRIRKLRRAAMLKDAKLVSSRFLSPEIGHFPWTPKVDAALDATTRPTIPLVSESPASPLTIAHSAPVQNIKLVDDFGSFTTCPEVQPSKCTKQVTQCYIHAPNRMASKGARSWAEMMTMEQCAKIHAEMKAKKYSDGAVKQKQDESTESSDSEWSMVEKEDVDWEFL